MSLIRNILEYDEDQLLCIVYIPVKGIVNRKISNFGHVSCIYILDSSCY